MAALESSNSESEFAEDFSIGKLLCMESAAWVVIRRSSP